MDRDEIASRVRLALSPNHSSRSLSPSKHIAGVQSASCRSASRGFAFFRERNQEWSRTDERNFRRCPEFRNSLHHKEKFITVRIFSSIHRRPVAPVLRDRTCASIATLALRGIADATSLRFRIPISKRWQSGAGKFGIQALSRHRSASHGQWARQQWGLCSCSAAL